MVFTNQCQTEAEQQNEGTEQSPGCQFIELSLESTSLEKAVFIAFLILSVTTDLIAKKRRRS